MTHGREGGPASATEKVLLARERNLVLDGAMLAARMVAARRVIVVVHDAVREIVDDAAAERKRARLDRVKIKVMTAAGGFVGGEGTALRDLGGRGRPPPHPAPPPRS